MPIIYVSQRFTLGQCRCHTICLLPNDTEHYLGQTTLQEQGQEGGWK